MAKEKKVTEITDMEVDFAQWFTDVCKKAQLIDYSSIKGVFIYRPYGYAIWENIQNIMGYAPSTMARLWRSNVTAFRVNMTCLWRTVSTSPHTPIWRA